MYKPTKAPRTNNTDKQKECANLNVQFKRLENTDFSSKEEKRVQGICFATRPGNPGSDRPRTNRLSRDHTAESCPPLTHFGGSARAPGLGSPPFLD